jgi:hypothetical protein
MATTTITMKAIRIVGTAAGILLITALAACGGSSSPASSAASSASAPASASVSAASILAADGYSPTAAQVSVAISPSWAACPYITGTDAGTSGSNAEEVVTFASRAGINAAGGPGALIAQAEASWPGTTVTMDGTVMKIDGPVSRFQGS